MKCCEGSSIHLDFCGECPSHCLHQASPLSLKCAAFVPKNILDVVICGIRRPGKICGFVRLEGREEAMIDLAKAKEALQQVEKWGLFET